MNRELLNKQMRETLDFKNVIRLLFRAIKSGDISTIDYILDTFSDAYKLEEAKDDLGRTAIEYTICLGDLNILSKLYSRWPKLYSRALLKSVDVDFYRGVEFLLKNERRRQSEKFDQKCKLKTPYIYSFGCCNLKQTDDAFSCLFHNNFDFKIIMENTRKSCCVYLF